MDEPSNSTISELISRIESYSQDPDSFASSSSSSSSTQPPNQDGDTESATQLFEELLALQSIYNDESLQLLCLSNSSDVSSTLPPQPKQWQPDSKITLVVSTEIEPVVSSNTTEPIPIRIAITLPPFYPHSTKPPQLQLLSRYIGGFSVNHTLFGEVLRAFYHQNSLSDITHLVTAISIDDDDNRDLWSAVDTGSTSQTCQGIQWIEGQVILFEGIEWVKEKVSEWWLQKEKDRIRNVQPKPSSAFQGDSKQQPTSSPSLNDIPTQLHPFRGSIVTAPEIVDRKSVFVGYAASIQHPDQVAQVLSQILNDRRVSKATHPTIHAWVCQTSDGVLHRDCDDDGESAAGGRLSHILSLLDLTNVIVIVTRWFGGIHLGADRFKLINRAARDALELADLIPNKPSNNSNKKS